MAEFELKHRDRGILVIGPDGQVVAKYGDMQQARRALEQLQAEGKIVRAKVKGQDDG